MGLPIYRQIASLNHSDNTLLSADIPREHLYATLWLRIAGDLVVTAGATLRENGILNLIKRIQIKAEGAVTVKNMNGALAFLTAKYESGVQPQLSQPAVGVATNPFSACIPISFILPPSYGRKNRYSSMLDSDLFKTLQLLINTGGVADVISAGTATLDNLTYTTHSMEISGIQNRITDMNIESQQDKNFTSASTNLEQDLPLGHFYRRFALRASDNGAQSDTMINSVKLKANGTNILVDLTWDQLLAMNKERFQQETMTTGFAILDLDIRTLGAEMLQSKNLSSLKLVYDVDVSADGLIEVLPSELILNPKSQAQKNVA